jgi:Arc/MetJ-type ribon-helix-helix transcriptional regulator
MTLTLDPALEERIQRELERGHFRTAAEVIEHALNLLQSQETWFVRNKDAINECLEVSMAQAERGEVYSPSEVRALLSKDRQDRDDRQSRATVA